MKTSMLLLAAALLSATGASAHSVVAARQKPARTHATTNPRVHTRALPGGGSLTYFEAEDSHDARHAQFAQLRGAFEAAMPTIVLYEGLTHGTDSTEAATIRHLGPAGYARFLAEQYGVPAESLDNQLAEYEYLRAKTDPEQLKLYYLLRYIQRYQAALPNAPKKLVLKAMQQLIANSYGFAPGTEHVIRNLAELRAAYRRHCPEGGSWRQVPAAYFDLDDPAAGGGTPFIQRINQDRAEFRQQYRAHKLAEYTQAGQRVLVVVAPGHVPAEPLSGGESSLGL